MTLNTLVTYPQALLFDLDGVLANVSGSYRQAIISTAESFGVNVNDKDVRDIKAAGNANNDWEVTWRLVTKHKPSVDIGEVTKRFEQLYQGNESAPGLKATERLIPDAGFLARLANTLPLALVTGRPKKDAEWFLCNHKIRNYFTTLVCMEDAPAKPSPEPIKLALAALDVSSAWMIGDTADDITAAQAANILPLGIPAPGDPIDWAQEILLSAGAVRLLEKLEELEDMLSWAQEAQM